ncbi:MAG: protein-L-isoaspartate(D-aspartate) O-methyltransferase [Dehalococcoidia bacterium]|nr:protein-L-isoaspartate(D-aspartate) O-methyltransferase [Dehalococcoidia bacterium]
MTRSRPDGGDEEPPQDQARSGTPSRDAYDLVAHLRRHATDDERVLEAILHTPREQFVPATRRPWAYEDRPLPIGAGQTISQPTIVAIMTAALALEDDARVLEIGTGSAYQAAILARLCRELVTLEAVPELEASARERLRTLGFRNVTVLPAGDDIGAPDLGPYDAILVTAASPAVPAPLLDQLAPGGRLVIPVGDRDGQQLLRITLTADGGRIEEDLGACRFVPLVGPYGFADPD